MLFLRIYLFLDNKKQLVWHHGLSRDLRGSRTTWVWKHHVKQEVNSAPDIGLLVRNRVYEMVSGKPMIALLSCSTSVLFFRGLTWRISQGPITLLQGLIDIELQACIWKDAQQGWPYSSARESTFNSLRLQPNRITVIWGITPIQEAELHVVQASLGTCHTAWHWHLYILMQHDVQI